ILQDGRIKFANQGLADIYGYTIAELLCLTPEQIEEMVHEADRKRIGSHLLQRLAGRIAAPIQVYRVVRKDGSVRWVEAQSARIDHEGLPAIQVSYKDATAEKAAEEQLKDAHQKMRNLADHLLRVREEERQHVSQEVHDE